MNRFREMGVGVGVGGRVVAWLGVAALLALAPTARAQNTSPAAPVILEPQLGVLIDPADVHMETQPISDPQVAAGTQVHRCTDWELLLDVSGVWELVWTAPCRTGVERVHTHLGDGTFVGFLAGRRTLLPDQNYRFRVRHRDSSNDPFSEWSPWSERAFTTGPASIVSAMDLDDIASVPIPRWLSESNTPFAVPLTTPRHTVEVRAACCGMPILELRGTGTITPEIVNSPAMPMGMPVKVVVRAGGANLALPRSNILFQDGDALERGIYLPEVSLNAFEEVTFWVDRAGNTYAAPDPTQPPSFEQPPVRRNLAAWTTSSDMRVSVVAGGFQLPVDIEFVPEARAGAAGDAPKFYVAELYGAIKVVRRDGSVTTFANNLLDFNPTGNFPGSGEAGLGAILVDNQSDDLFATLVYDGNPDPNSVTLYNRVVRLVSTDGGRTASSIQTIWDSFPVESAPSHQVSNIMFGNPAGTTLLVHVGDGFIAAAARDLNDPRGKVLRMTRAGAPASGNPWLNLGDGVTTRDYVFALGFRNAFGGTRRESDNTLWFVENGPNRDRLGRLVLGRDYQFDGTDESMLAFASFTWFPAVAPVSIAALDPLVFSGSGFPASYQGRMYVTQSGSTWASGPGTDREKVINEFVIDSLGTVLSGPRAVATYSGIGQATAAAIAAGPDGIYFSDLYKDDDTQNPIATGAQILKLSYRVPFDCDNNGIADDEDIAQGRLRDCNQNLLPDECEVQAGLAQACDPAQGLNECVTLSPTTYTFADIGNLPEGTAFYGSTTIENNALVLARSSVDTEGTFIFDTPTPGPFQQLRLEMDVRLSGDLRGNGLGIFAVDSQQFPGLIFVADDGTLQGSVGVGLDVENVLAGQSGASVARLIRDRFVLSESTIPGWLGDGQWRRVRLHFGAAGLTLAIRNLPNGPWTVLLRNQVIQGYTPFPARIALGHNALTPSARAEVDNLTLWLHNATDPDRDLIPDTCGCGDVDFNNDGVFPDDADLADLLFVLGGGICATCDTVDFNRDGVFPEDADVAQFLIVLGGGTC